MGAAVVSDVAGVGARQAAVPSRSARRCHRKASRLSAATRSAPARDGAGESDWTVEDEGGGVVWVPCTKVYPIEENVKKCYKKLLRKPCWFPARGWPPGNPLWASNQPAPLKLVFGGRARGELGGSENGMVCMKNHLSNFKSFGSFASASITRI